MFDGVAFQTESRSYPNYGKSLGLDTYDWWVNVRCLFLFYFTSFFSLFLERGKRSRL